MSKAEPGKMYHIKVTKRYLLHAILADGGKAVLSNWEGTDEEAMQAVRELPTECVPMSECDNWDPETGECLGHPQRGHDERS